MALSARKKGQASVRARHSRFTRTVFVRLAPFFAVEEVSGGPLFLATLLALAWINSPWSASYHAVWSTVVGVRLGDVIWQKPLSAWARDALLPVFFFGVGIEVKREFIKGLLSNRLSAMLPICAAAGGMVVPAMVYLALTSATPLMRGWGVTVTTDTAFALALLGLFATQLPRSVRVLLLAFAAVDDVGGLAVIAFVYTHQVDWWMLAAAMALLIAIVVLRRCEIIASIPYVLLGLGVLICVEASGVHSTIAGVLLGALIPVEPRLPETQFVKIVQSQVDGVKEANEHIAMSDDPDQRQRALAHQEANLGRLSETTHATYEAAQRITHAINPWISYIVLPFFALSNAGVTLSPTALADGFGDRAALAIIAALFIGKPAGVMLFSWLAARIRIARLPDAMTWPMMFAIATCSGIGFSISLFIANLAFSDGAHREHAKMAVLFSSVLSAIVGYIVLHWASAKRSQTV